MTNTWMAATVLVLAGSANGCPHGGRQALPSADPATIDMRLKGVQQLVVRDSREQVVATISETQAMRSFASLLPKSEFDDIFGESGDTQYDVELVGPGRYNDRIWITATHIRHGKGAAKLSAEHRAALLRTLGITP